MADPGGRLLARDGAGTQGETHHAVLIDFDQGVGGGEGQAQEARGQVHAEAIRRRLLRNSDGWGQAVRFKATARPSPCMAWPEAP